MLPARLAAYNDPYFSKSAIRKVYKKVLLTATSYPPLSVWCVVENSVISEFFNILSAYIDGKLKPDSIQKYLDKSKKKIDAALSKEK